MKAASALRNKRCHSGSERSELSGISSDAPATEIPDDSASRVSGMTRERDPGAVRRLQAEAGYDPGFRFRRTPTSTLSPSTGEPSNVQGFIRIVAASLTAAWEKPRPSGSAPA